ncbi:hypothetical protein [Peribacillus asahii]|uniref:Uncharacterized protein n=1 Tax=Peribacillus asahii TaxID=228899 RepID=A0A3T0KQI8_9BACI|nr:hypothetical protein [Peribacillus asahii]AZV42533.1 hypothetical protein BAOM_1924 [Peribacillus asahii]USK86813.1 hypothetical protein LIT35_09330 [Peribacillus asahii]
MKGHFLHVLKYAVLVISVCLSYQAVEAHDKGFKSNEFYEAMKRDVTGDKKIDTIELRGTPSEKNRHLLTKMELVVESNCKRTSIPLEAGYKPKLALADFNKDGVQDVFVSFQKQNKSELFHQIYSFDKGQVANIEVPPSVPVTAQFQDYYMADITVEGQKPVRVDISSHRQVYEELGIYQNGKLNEATELIIHPYFELTVRSQFGRGKGLTGKQLVKGIEGEEAIATISSVWSFQDGAWKLIKANVKPLKKIKNR